MTEVAASNRNMSTRLQSLLSLLALIVRIILWPLRGFARLAFPPNDLDGLSPAVTAKSAQAFLSLLSPSPSAHLWSTTGFAALRDEASESLLLVYLHSPLHRQAKVCLDRILTNTRFQEFLQQPHLSALGCSIHSGQGAQLAQMLHAASYPMMALLQPGSSSSLQLVFSVQGPVLMNMRADQLVQYLNTALTRHQVQLAQEEMRRLQREQEQELRREQDAEYQATLLADQERQRALAQQEEDRVRQEREAEEQQEQAVRSKVEALQRARDAVRPAPTEGGTRIRFVLPSGKKMERRFESDETIGALKAYLMVQFHENEDEENRMERIGLSTSYPKQTYDEDGVTLEEAGLGKQAVLMVQDLDA